MFYLSASTTLHKMANKIDIKKEQLYISDAYIISKKFKRKAFNTFLNKRKTIWFY